MPGLVDCFDEPFSSVALSFYFQFTKRSKQETKVKQEVIDKIFEVTKNAIEFDLLQQMIRIEIY